MLTVLLQNENWDRTHYDCQVDWSCGWVSTDHSNMWFSWITEQSQDVSPSFSKPCLTCSYPPKWQPAAHGNKQKLLTNLSDQVHMHRLLEFEVVSCFPKKLPRIYVYIYIYIHDLYNLPSIFWRPWYQGQLLELPQRSPFGVPLPRQDGMWSKGHDHYGNLWNPPQSTN